MGRWCCVPGCPDKHGSDPLQIFHRFPGNSVLAHKWLQIIQNPNINANHSRICSLHFSPDCYQRDLRNELLGRATKKLLLPTALPDTFICLPRPQQNFNGSFLKITDFKNMAGKVISESLIKEEPDDALDEQEVQIPAGPVLKIGPEEFKFTNYLDNSHTSTTALNMKCVKRMKKTKLCGHDGLRTMVTRALEFQTDDPNVSCEMIQSYIENTFSVSTDCTNALERLVQEGIVIVTPSAIDVEPGQQYYKLFGKSLDDENGIYESDPTHTNKNIYYPSCSCLRPYPGFRRIDFLKKSEQKILAQKSKREQIEEKIEFERMIKQVLTTREDSPVTLTQIEKYMKTEGRPSWSLTSRPLTSRIKKFLAKSLKNGTVIKVQGNKGRHLAYRMIWAMAPKKKSSMKKLKVSHPQQDPLESSAEVKVENEKDVLEEIDVKPFSIDIKYEF